MQIRPPGSGGPITPPSGGGDSPARRVTGAQARESAQTPRLPGVESRFKAADLRNEATRETVVRAAVSELVDAKLAAQGRGALDPSERKHLEDWLQADPTVRALLERYLEGALK